MTAMLHCYYANRPKRDSHGRVVHVHNMDTEDISGSHAPVNDDEMSVKLLDEILAKAQTARYVSKVINITTVTNNINVIV